MPRRQHRDSFERATALAIAADCDVDYRSVLKRMHGYAVKGPAGRRIECALEQRGIVQLCGEKSLGQIAYEARSGAAPWDDLDITDRMAWVGVATAVVAEHERRNGNG
jgi:hypothetical protein